ncbi:MAG: DUF1697 domain-containing protein [Acidimicrobiales bacterium]
MTASALCRTDPAMSVRYVALLRGVNVGGKNIVAMSELRKLFDSLGYSSVRTFIQSGNVVFTSNAGVTPDPTFG